MTLPVFVTGNQDKADYLAKLLDVPLKHSKIELDEIQTEDLQELAEHKVKQAYDVLKQPVLIEDVSLHFNALDGLPGPFIKYFTNKEDGLEKLCRMLDGFSDRGARAASIFAFYDGTTITLLEGDLSGAIAKHPRGSAGFGWDKIFCPDGFDGKTRAELGEVDDLSTYKTIKPIDELKAFLRNRGEQANG